MVIFNSYVSLPEGNLPSNPRSLVAPSPLRAVGVPVATEWAKGVWRAEASPEVSTLKWSSMTWMIWGWPGWPYFMKPPNEENSWKFEENENPQEKPRKHEDLKMKNCEFTKTIKNWGIGPCLTGIHHRKKSWKSGFRYFTMRSGFVQGIACFMRHLGIFHDQLAYGASVWRPNIIEPYKQ